MATFLLVLVHALARRAQLLLEIHALRQQLAVYQRTQPRPRLTLLDRIYWLCISTVLPHWRQVLFIVTPATVVAWHRAGFRLLWKLKSHARPGPHCIDSKTKQLIRDMANANPLWGAPRIHGELRKLGIEVAQSTVSRYMPKRPKKPSTTWLPFLRNHLHCAAAVDFFTVVTSSMRILYVCVVLSHARRRIVHVNVTEHPTAEWTAAQVREAFPFETAPAYLHHDRGSGFGWQFQRQLQVMGIEPVRSAFRAPWQNPFVERVIGSMRRECLDHVIILSEGHLRWLLRQYVEYYNRSRTHLALSKDAPEPRPIQFPEFGPMVVTPQVGGMHHRYERSRAA